LEEEMRTRPALRILALALLVALAAACTLPGAASPTQFAFPTPNLTHTAIFAAILTPSATAPSAPTPLAPTTSGTPPPPTSEAGTPAATATLGGASRPNGSPVTAAYLPSAPTIDGNISEWTSTAYAIDQIVFGAANWVGANDASATYYIGWDTGNLYLAVRVRDEAHVQINGGANLRYLYKGDDVEIQLDTNLSGDFYATSVDSDDYQLGFTPGNFGTLSPQAYLWIPAAQEGTRASVGVQVRQVTNGYELEARIPWTVFGISPAGGNRYGFAISASDNDLAGTATQQSMVSNVRNRRLLNPTTWGTLILEAPGGS
jgi:hypothetical protein